MCCICRITQGVCRTRSHSLWRVRRGKWSLPGPGPGPDSRRTIVSSFTTTMSHLCPVGNSTFTSIPRIQPDLHMIPLWTMRSFACQLTDQIFPIYVISLPSQTTSPHLFSNCSWFAFIFVPRPSLRTTYVHIILTTMIRGGFLLRNYVCGTQITDFIGHHSSAEIAPF